MTFAQILHFHAASGTIALLSAIAALAFRKGAQKHNFAGNVFVASMLFMSISSVYIAYVRGAKDSLFVGLLAFYLVVTSWWTAIRRKKQVGSWEYISLLFILVYGVSALLIAVDGEYAKADSLYIFAVLAALLAGGDTYLIVRGGLRGPQRIARHLWRMCLALFWSSLAVIGQPKLFPESIRATHILFVPVAAVVLVTIYWLHRVLLRGGVSRA